MSQMKSCDCKICKLKANLLMKGIRFARAIEWYLRECERFFFIFARKSCDIVYLESSRSTLESTCRRLVEMASSEKIFKFLFS